MMCGRLSLHFITPVDHTVAFAVLHAIVVRGIIAYRPRAIKRGSAPPVDDDSVLSDTGFPKLQLNFAL